MPQRSIDVLVEKRSAPFSGFSEKTYNFLEIKVFNKAVRLVFSDTYVSKRYLW